MKSATLRKEGRKTKFEKEENKGKGVESCSLRGWPVANKIFF